MNIDNEIGNPCGVNVLLLGLVAHIPPLEKQTLLDAMKKRMPKKIIDINLETFKSGRKLAER